MRVLNQWLCAVSATLCCSFAVAQTPYDKIDVGTILKGGNAANGGGIGLGTFVKPLPLPEGEWLVVNKRIDSIGLTGGNGPSQTPKISLTLKNNVAAVQIFAMVLTFTPDAVPIRWGNNKCESSNPKTLVDDFGLSPSGLLYMCANTVQLSAFKNTVASTPQSSIKWYKANLTALSEYPNDIADSAFLVDLYGSRDRGRSINLTFLIKREGDVASDATYATHIKDWVHTTGLSFKKVLENDATTFEPPKAYVGASGALAPATPSSAAASK